MFIVALILSGVTAFPLLTELRLLGRWIGVAAPERYAEVTGLQHWIGYVLYGLEETHRRFPFLAYGTDWLAFGHICIAIFFVRPFFHPHDSGWVLKCGLVCCAAVVPLAAIAGEVRGIPIYWRALDCSFGLLGAWPLWYCLRLTPKLGPAAAR